MSVKISTSLNVRVQYLSNCAFFNFEGRSRHPAVVVQRAPTVGRRLGPDVEGQNLERGRRLREGQGLRRLHPRIVNVVIFLTLLQVFLTPDFFCFALEIFERKK